MKTVLVVAGTDPLHGAGVVLDALVLREQGIQAMSVPAALVAQNSRGVRSWTPVALADLERMLQAVAEDRTPDAIKVGMVGGADRLRWVLRHMRDFWPRSPVVIDPVLASGGSSTTALATSSNPLAWCEALEGATLVTPNVHELAFLGGTSEARGAAQLQAQAEALAHRTGVAVLAKGGHLADPGTDVFVQGAATTVMGPHAWRTQDIHGTGCCLSSLVAGGLAMGKDLVEAVVGARTTLAQWGNDPTRVARVGQGRPQFVFMGHPQPGGPC